MNKSFKDRILNWLTHPRLPLIVAFLAILLALSSMNTGLQFDDYTHRSKIQRSDLSSDKSFIMDLFTFRDGSLEKAKIMMSKGKRPWWTLPEIRVSFFRPLTAVTHWLDYQLWPQKPMLMHLHSLLWLGVMTFSAALVYRRMMVSFRVAGLAALLFAIDDAHGVPAGWLACRNILIAGTFVFLCLYLHDRWRQDRWRTGAVLAPACFLLGLLSAEAAISAVGYIVAYETTLMRSNWRRKAVGVLPYVLIGITWQAVYRYLGYGTYGSGLYIDPGQEPFAYLAALFERLPLLLYGQWFLPDVIFYGYIHKPFDLVIIAGVGLLLAGMAAVMLPLLKTDARARFWAFGMFLSLFPVCATMPMNRLLVIAGLGAMGLLSQFLAAWLEKPAWLPASKIWRRSANVTVIIFVAVHLIIAPLSLPFKSRGMKNFARISVENSLFNLSEKTDIANKILIFVNPPVPFSISFVKEICKTYHLVAPREAFVLGSGLTSDYMVRRMDDHALEIEVQNGFIDQDLERLYRGTTHPMQVGQQVDASFFQAQVLSLTRDKRPKKVRFRFSYPLEDESLLFCIWRGYNFEVMELPLPGQTVELASILPFI